MTLHVATPPTQTVTLVNVVGHSSSADATKSPESSTAASNCYPCRTLHLWAPGHAKSKQQYCTALFGAWDRFDPCLSAAVFSPPDCSLNFTSYNCCVAGSMHVTRQQQMLGGLPRVCHTRCKTPHGTWYTPHDTPPGACSPIIHDHQVEIPFVLLTQQTHIFHGEESGLQ